MCWREKVNPPGLSRSGRVSQAWRSRLSIRYADSELSPSENGTPTGHDQAGTEAGVWAGKSAPASRNGW